MSTAEPEVIEYPFDKSDVRIEDYIPMCGECDQEPATKLVKLDFRGLGQEIAFGDNGLCEECATEIAERIRGSLPAPKEDV